MEASCIPQSIHGTMDEEDDLGSPSSFFEDEGSSNSMGSSSSEFMEDEASSNSCSGPLYEMSSLIAQLPVKRGLSKHFQGKSQSFTSLSDVRCLEDLAKPEKPYKKRLKSSKSYGGGLDSHKALSPKACSRAITKKASRGSFSSLSGRRPSFLGSRPPVPPQRTASFSDQTLLFA